MKQHGVILRIEDKYGLGANSPQDQLTTISQIIFLSPTLGYLTRYLPVIGLVDKIRQKLMLMMNVTRTMGAKLRGKLIPYVDRHFQNIRKKLGAFQVRHTSDTEAEDEDETTRRIINLKDKTCSCNIWQITELSCINVLTSMDA